MKTKKCGRCGGTGTRNCPTLHMGVPGLCYQCDGTGELVWLSAEQVTAEYRRNKERHLAELVELGTTTKARLEAERARRPDRQTCTALHLEQDLESFRKLWREVSRDLKNFKAARGKWVSKLSV